MSKRRTADLVAAIEDVPTVFVEQTDMNMQSASRLFEIGLGHEGHLKPMLTCHALHGAFEHDALISGQKRIGLMAQIDLELPWCILGRQGAGINSLFGTGLDRVPQELSEVVDRRHAIDLCFQIAQPGDRRKRRSRRAIIPGVRDRLDKTPARRPPQG